MKSVPVLSLALLSAVTAFAQSPASLAPAVRDFVREDAPMIVLQHVRVIDGTGAPARDDQTLVIANGKIQALGPGPTIGIPIPASARILDLTGTTVIPGIVGMHDHMYYPAPNGPPAMYPQHASSFPRLYLAAGVTTVRTAGSLETYTDLEMKKLIDSGRMAGPKMHLTGPY